MNVKHVVACPDCGAGVVAAEWGPMDPSPADRRAIWDQLGHGWTFAPIPPEIDPTRSTGWPHRCGARAKGVRPWAGS